MSEREHGDVEFDFSLPIEQKQVKARLAQLYKEQQHAGERHGLQKGQRQNATTWHIMREFSVLRHGSDGDRFERELRKIMFNVIDTGTDADAATAAVAMTPAKSKGLQPTSVTQIIWALAGACSSAPTHAELASLALPAGRPPRLQRPAARALARPDRALAVKYCGSLVVA